jgi:hypothetical protein
MVGRAGMYHKGIGSDTHHKGMGQAGNKSILSYRADIGVPGENCWPVVQCSAGHMPAASAIQSTCCVPSLLPSTTQSVTDVPARAEPAVV